VQGRLLAEVDGGVVGAVVLSRGLPEHYREQIANRRRLDELITAMDDISTQARQLLLGQTPTNRRRKA
jgi:hypothetical protein